MTPDPSGSRKDGRDRLPNDRARSRGRSRDAGECKGLCVSCANRETCLFPRAEGGVWHCEEYVEDG